MIAGATNYVQTALFFQLVKETRWADVDPKLVLGYDYSAGQRNVADRVVKIRGLFFLRRLMAVRAAVCRPMALSCGPAAIGPLKA
jgi:hypothetical protein